MKMSFDQFRHQIEKSKSYNVTELFVSTVPAELFINNSMNIPVSTERNMRKFCTNSFATDKDKCDYEALMEHIMQNVPLQYLVRNSSSIETNH